MIKEKYLNEFKVLCTYTPAEIQAWAKEESVLKNRELQMTLTALAYIGNDEVISSETETENVRRLEFNANHPPEMYIPEPQCIPKDADKEVSTWLRENGRFKQRSESEWIFWVEVKTGAYWLQNGLKRVFYRFVW